ncbi:tetratricopeptide repeat protein [Candidatus Omnitrophota bacterium]
MIKKILLLSVSLILCTQNCTFGLRPIAHKNAPAQQALLGKTKSSSAGKVEQIKLSKQAEADLQKLIELDDVIKEKYGRVVEIGLYGILKSPYGKKEIKEFILPDIDNILITDPMCLYASKVNRMLDDIMIFGGEAWIQMVGEQVHVFAKCVNNKSESSLLLKGIIPEELGLEYLIDRNCLRQAVERSAKDSAPDVIDDLLRSGHKLPFRDDWDLITDERGAMFCKEFLKKALAKAGDDCEIIEIHTHPAAGKEECAQWLMKRIGQIRTRINSQRLRAAKLNSITDALISDLLEAFELEGITPSKQDILNRWRSELRVSAGLAADEDLDKTQVKHVGIIGKRHLPTSGRRLLVWPRDIFWYPRRTEVTDGDQWSIMPTLIHFNLWLMILENKLRAAEPAYRFSDGYDPVLVEKQEQRNRAEYIPPLEEAISYALKSFRGLASVASLDFTFTAKASSAGKGKGKYYNSRFDRDNARRREKYGHGSSKKDSMKRETPGYRGKNTARSLYKAAQGEERSGRLKSAAGLYLEAARANTVAGNRNDAGRSFVSASTALYKLGKGKFREAIAAQNQALEHKVQLHDIGGQIISYISIGTMHAELDEIDEALKAFETAIRIGKQSRGQEYHYISALVRAATLLAELGRDAEAAELFEESATTFESTLNSPSEAARSWVSCSYCRRLRGDSSGSVDALLSAGKLNRLAKPKQLGFALLSYIYAIRTCRNIADLSEKKRVCIKHARQILEEMIRIATARSALALLTWDNLVEDLEKRYPEVFTKNIRRDALELLAEILSAKPKAEHPAKIRIFYAISSSA